jgi:cytochrome c biogenesis protein CcmG/thiol:disulfide interchange protein DsbE
VTTPKPPARNGSVIWIAALVVVVVLGVVAVVAARAGRDDEKPVTAKEKDAQTSDVTIGAGGGADGGDGEGTATTAEGGPVEPLPELPESGPDPAVGRAAPTIAGETLDGDPITIGPDGTAQVIAFVAHWCPHCQKEVPLIVEHLKGTPMPDDVALRTVSTSVDPGRPNYPPKAWLDREGWPVPVLADSENSLGAAVYGLTSFPYFVAVDADGKVVERAIGEISMERFDELVEAARSGS